jgi:hypothetical protein
MILTHDATLHSMEGETSIELDISLAIPVVREARYAKRWRPKATIIWRPYVRRSLSSVHYTNAQETPVPAVML